MTQNMQDRQDTQKITNRKIASKPMSRKKRLLIFVSAFLVLIVIAVSAYLLFLPRVQPLSLPALPHTLTVDEMGLANWRVYQQSVTIHPLDEQSIQPSLQTDAAQILLEDALGETLLKQGNTNRALGYLKAAVQSDPDNLRYTNDYRVALRDHGLFKDEETFFTDLLAKQSTQNTMLNMALVYVDEMRSCPKPPDGLVCQAQFSSRSITLLDGLLEQHPYNIAARFARGLNHLYWPTLMGHLPRSQVDMQYAVALLKYLASIKNSFTPQAYAALGDVFAKSGKIAEARNVWLNGKNATSNSIILDKRLAIAQDQLVHEEDTSIRGLGVYVDTSISLFWS